jgi:hypothetical protein
MCKTTPKDGKNISTSRYRANGNNEGSIKRKPQTTAWVARGKEDEIMQVGCVQTFRILLAD